AGGVVVGVLERGHVGIQAGVHTEDQREGGRRFGRPSERRRGQEQRQRHPASGGSHRVTSTEIRTSRASAGATSASNRAAVCTARSTAVTSVGCDVNQP